MNREQNSHTKWVGKRKTLTDNETTLLDINKWIGGGTKLSLTKTVDADILRAIVIKLQ
jgi:hypothetical protein